MSKVSTVEKYTIDGVELACYPTSVQFSDNLVSKSYNTINARFVDIPVALKEKVNFVFEYAESDKIEAVYRLIREHEINQGNRNFAINYKCPDGTWRVGDFYLGTPTTFTSKASKGKGNITVWSLELHFIEIEGESLQKKATSTK